MDIIYYKTISKSLETFVKICDGNIEFFSTQSSDYHKRDQKKAVGRLCRRKER